MGLRYVTVDDLCTLDFEQTPEGWKIFADLTCARCGAYQAADADPAPAKDRQAVLAVRLFGQAGWRVEEASRAVLCVSCAGGWTGRG